MKKKLILGLFVCVLILSLSLSLNISVKANASTNELRISPILVPIEKVDLVQNLISDIEFDLSEKDTNVILELSTFKAKCQELLFTNDNENLEILINEIDEIILEYSEYKSVSNFLNTFGHFLHMVFDSFAIFV